MRKTAILAAAIAVVVGGWTAAWAYARSTVLARMDEALAAVAADGVAVDCPDRAAGGWPFRLQVTCSSPSVVLADGRRIGAPAVAATWHVVDPRLVLVEAASPVTVSTGGTTVTTAFGELRASLRLESMESGRVSVEVDRPVVSTGTAAGVVADRVEVHVRPTPGRERGYDLAVTARRLEATAEDGTPVLPARADAGIDLTVLEAPFLALGGDPAGWATAGGRVDLREAVLVVGDTRITAGGSGTLTAGGAAQATIDAVATRIDWLTAEVQAGRRVPPALAALGSAFLLLGRPLDGDGAPRALTIAVDEGAVTANGLPIATLPPLARAP